MGRRRTAGRDTKIVQGHQRDQFFAKMRRRGGVARLPNQAPDTAIAGAEPGVDERSRDQESGAEGQAEPEPGEKAEETDRSQE
jgi:hypothetical protein